MSLHGLEAPAISQAAAAAQANSAGWFLLRYATRDEIELYSSGNGGLTDVTASIAAYEEKSPLYGLVTHNGRKVLMRCVPTGTSRLLQARVKVHFEAISTQFPHDAELSINQADELTGEALAAASPSSTPATTSLPLSPALSLSNPASPIPSSLGRLPSNAGSSSAHGSSVNGDSAIKEEDESSTPSSRTARLLADVRAGKLESHEVLAALKITSTRESERRPSDTPSVDRLKESANALRTEDAARTASVSSLDQQVAQFPSPRPSLSSHNADLYKAKVKVGPRPSHSADSSVASHVASLPAGVSLSKPAAPTQPPSAQTSTSPTSVHSANLSPALGESHMRPIVQSPASVISATGKAGSIAGTAMTLPPTLGQRKGSASSLQSPKDQQAVEKMRLMKALEMQRKKQAKHAAGDDLPSAEPSPVVSSNFNSPTAANFEAPTSLADALERNGDRPARAPVPEIDIAATRRLHAATKSSPTLGSMVNFPLHERQNVDIKQVEGQHGDSVTTAAPPRHPEPPMKLPDLTASGPATLQLGQSSGNDHDDQATQTRDEQRTKKVPAPINTNIDLEQLTEEGQRTPVATARDNDGSSSAGIKRFDLDSVRPDMARMHSAHVSISTSISGNSAFLEELESSNVEQAQPMTMVKSPITPTLPRSPGLPKPGSFAPVESKLRHVEADPVNPSQATTIDTGLARKGAEKQIDKEPQSADAPTQATGADTVNNNEPEEPLATKSAPMPSNNLTESEQKTAEPALDASKILSEAEAEPPISAPSPQNLQAQSDSVSSSYKPVNPSAGENVVDPMKAIIEAELGNTGSAIAAVGSKVSNDASATVKSTDTLANAPDLAEKPSGTEVGTPGDESVDPLSISKEGSPSTKKHPTVQPPHIWGGALRSASNPLSDTPRHLSPVPDLSKMTRSASAASNNSALLRSDSPSGAKKVGVGSRIADRIKALEKSSGAASSSSGPVYAGSVVSVSSRKSSFHTPPGSSGTDARRINTSSPNNIFARRFGTVHGATTGDRSSRPSSSASPESAKDQSTNVSADAAPTSAPRPEYFRHESSDSQNANMMPPPSRDGGSSVTSQQKSKSSFISWTARRDSAETARTGHSRHSSIESVGTNSDKKKENKAKKLMKRVSGAFSPRKERSAPSFGEPIMESAEPEPPKTAASSYATRPPTRDASSGGVVSKGSSRPASKPSNNIVVGEVNVQFPDTLLWKRRHVELDSDGFIILAASTLEKSSRVAPKKFHVSDFHSPFIPDQEREELPYSIVLNFQDSSTLQCACQNAVDQKNVLQALLKFHASYAKA